MKKAIVAFLMVFIFVVPISFAAETREHSEKPMKDEAEKPSKEKTAPTKKKSAPTKKKNAQTERAAQTEKAVQTERAVQTDRAVQTEKSTQTILAPVPLANPEPAGIAPGPGGVVRGIQQPPPTQTNEPERKEILEDKIQQRRQIENR